MWMLASLVEVSTDYCNGLARTVRSSFLPDGTGFAKVDSELVARFLCACLVPFAAACELPLSPPRRVDLALRASRAAAVAPPLPKAFYRAKAFAF